MALFLRLILLSNACSLFDLCHNFPLMRAVMSSRSCIGVQGFLIGHYRRTWATDWRRPGPGLEAFRLRGRVVITWILLVRLPICETIISWVIVYQQYAKRINLYEIQPFVLNVPGIRFHNNAFLHAKPWIPGGEKAIFTAVIHWWRSPLRQLARARTIDEYNVTMPVPTFAWRHRSTLVTSQC